jgi:LysM repeat protein
MDASGMYTVKSGDTLSALAEEFEVNLEDLMAANQLTDASVLQVGQALIIPSLVQSHLPRPAPTMGPNVHFYGYSCVTYTPSNGDSLQ